MKKISSLWTLLHSLPVATFYFTVKAWHCSFLVLSTVLILTSSFPLGATEEATESNIEAEGDRIIELNDDIYIGVFIGSGRVYNEHTDVEGFANWGHPGSSVDYENTEPVGGVLIGKQLRINGVPLRIELDGTFGDMSASTNTLDPEGLDETAKADVRWIVTARAGLEKDLGPATIFANTGLAVARISNSVIDIDFSSTRPPQEDPDDSFRDDSIQIGWVVGAGAEVALDGKGKAKTLRDAERWILRMEGAYINFGEDTYTVNHSGNNSCGPGGLRRPCFYNIKNEFGIIRVALIRRFSL